ncbi:MAG TPA: zf-HC2 domain-containing protein [Pyrinomonadaceae bacterium]|jgi:anti-sigma factor RsiW|nr:zf-HC2 domain-containing protein [Pyrinomonadaceae bacterium]
MNCERCQELLSEFLDGTLPSAEHASVLAHLGGCFDCARAREEFQAIVNTAHASGAYLYEPRDEDALWERIRLAAEAEGLGRPKAEAQAVGFWSRLFAKKWELSLPQLATAAAALVVLASFATTLGFQYLSSGRGPAGQRAAAPRRVVSAGHYPEGYLRPHQASMQYWQQRVEQRKANWNPRMRASFDRSLNVLDEAVSDSLTDLQQNPHDEVAEEMLNSALRDKIDLLREFGEQ